MIRVLVIKVIAASTFGVWCWDRLVDRDWLAIVCSCKITNLIASILHSLLLRWYEILYSLSLKLLDVKSMPVDVLHLFENFTLGWDVILHIFYFLGITWSSQVLWKFTSVDWRVLGRGDSDFMWISIDFFERWSANVIDLKDVGLFTFPLWS